jgi:hypothetical protein
MWMTDYILEIKKQFRDVYGFKPNSRSTSQEPLFDDIPDGEYPVVIDGKTDKVIIKDGKINCCNFE